MSIGPMEDVALNFTRIKAHAAQFMDYTDDSCLDAAPRAPGNVVILCSSLPGGSASGGGAWLRDLQPGALHQIAYNGHAGLGLG